MTSATLTLTDFLLARIAEDEEGARGELEMPARSALGIQWLDLMRRVLAECEAKRRIVEYVRTFQGGLEAMDAESGRAGRRWQLEAQVLGALAAVYADHKDYREEWRP